MTSTRLFSIAFCSALLLTGCGATGTGFGESSSSSSEMSSADSSSAMSDISVTNPMPNQIVTSPLVVQGSARGSWFFEASFPAKLLDAHGNVIVQSHVQAGGNWMTDSFVPFAGALIFTQPATATGTLILQKDNPSGLPEHDASIQVPVLFQ